MRAGDGPIGYDCWGFMRKLYLDFLGVYVLPHSECRVSDALTNGPSINKAIFSSEDCPWEEVSQPEDWCAVAMGKGKRLFTHVGVYRELDGGIVLHCRKGSGSIAQPVNQILKDWSNVKFYVYRNRNI